MSTTPLFDLSAVQALGRKVAQVIREELDVEPEDTAERKRRADLLGAARAVLTLCAVDARAHGTSELLPHVRWWIGLGRNLDEASEDALSPAFALLDALGRLLELGAPVDDTVRALAASRDSQRREIVARHLCPTTPEAIDLLVGLASTRAPRIRAQARANLGIHQAPPSRAERLLLEQLELLEPLLARVHEPSKQALAASLLGQLNDLRAHLAPRVSPALVEQAQVPRWVGIVEADPRPSLDPDQRARWEHLEAKLSGCGSNLRGLAGELVAELDHLPEWLALDVLRGLFAEGQSKSRELFGALLARSGGPATALQIFLDLERGDSLGGACWLRRLIAQATPEVRDRLLDEALRVLRALIAAPAEDEGAKSREALAQVVASAWPTDRDPSPLLDLGLSPVVAGLP